MSRTPKRLLRLARWSVDETAHFVARWARERRPMVGDEATRDRVAQGLAKSLALGLANLPPAELDAFVMDLAEAGVLPSEGS